MPDGCAEAGDGFGAGAADELGRDSRSGLRALSKLAQQVIEVLRHHWLIIAWRWDYLIQEVDDSRDVGT
jgi:hypothetical protein